MEREVVSGLGTRERGRARESFFLFFLCRTGKKKFQFFFPLSILILVLQEVFFSLSFSPLLLHFFRNSNNVRRKPYPVDIQRMA